MQIEAEGCKRILQKKFFQKKFPKKFYDDITEKNFFFQKLRKIGKIDFEIFRKKGPYAKFVVLRRSNQNEDRIEVLKTVLYGEQDVTIFVPL